MDVAYHLADVLQMRLTYTNGNYTGAVKVALADIPVLFTMNVVEWFKQQNAMGLLCSVKGDLMMLCTVRQKSSLENCYFMFLIDKTKLTKAALTKTTLKPTDTYESALEKVRPGIVMSYAYNGIDKTWKEGLNNVKTVDRINAIACNESNGIGSKAVSGVSLQN